MTAARTVTGWVPRNSSSSAELGRFPPEPPDDAQHAHYKHYCYVRPDFLRTGWTRDRIMAEITAKGVPCFSGSCSEIYLEKAFDTDGLRPP